MNITNIKHSYASQTTEKYSPVVMDKNEIVNYQVQSKAIADKNDVTPQTNWQKDVLMQGLNMLESKIQLKLSGSSRAPREGNATLLDKPENRPIESFADAMTELKNITPDMIFRQGSKAQANMSHQVVFELLTEM